MTQVAPPVSAAATPAAECAGDAAPSGTTRRLRRIGAHAVAFLLLGAAANVLMAVVLALLVDVSAGTIESAEAWTGRDAWTVTRWSRTGAAYIASTRDMLRDWSPGQATGAPDALAGGDSVRAWASASADGQEEWLVVEFGESVVPSAVKVYETCGTGALTKVTAFTGDGKEVEAWKGTDPTPHGARLGTSEVPLRTNFVTRKLKLHIDSAGVPGWNEVDAVELVGVDGRTQWATGAHASSVYLSSVAASAATVSGGPAALAPPWSGLGQPAQSPHRSVPGLEQRAVEARGWPMLAMWSEVAASRAPGGGGAAAVPSGRGSSAKFITGGIALGRTGSTKLPPLAPVSGRASLPVRPIWRGFLINSAFYAVVLFLLHWALTVPRRFVREVSRLRRGCCVACGYDLGFDFVPGCPECGWRRRQSFRTPSGARARIDSLSV